MKPIPDVAGIPRKRGSRIPIPNRLMKPESDSQRRAVASRPRSSGPPPPPGAKFLCGTQKKVFGASFEGRCVFFFGALEVMRIFC